MTLKRATLFFLPLASFIVFFWLSQMNKHPNSVWIYASIYKEVVADFDEALRREFPELRIFWYQSGSENVAARVNAELSTGSTHAQILMTSDPFWYLELKRAGHLFPYSSRASSDLPHKYRDPENTFMINRLPIGVIAYDKSVISKNLAPRSWDDLTHPKWRNKLTMPSPLESGTATTFVSQLVRQKGWDYFKALQRNNLLASGGNSAVIQRIENKEMPMGIVLLENALQAQKRGSPVEIVYPSEGVILVPSPIALIASSEVNDSTKQVYDFFFSEKAQEIFVKHHVYSPLKPSLFPAGARPFSEIEKTVFDWDANILEELQRTKDADKKTFTELIIK